MKISNRPRHIKAVIITSCLIAVTSSCVQRQHAQKPELTIEAGDPLRFVVKGNGIVEFFSVSGVNSPNALHMYWQIVPVKDTDLSALEKLGPIAYGHVPPGFRQVVPEKGEPQPIRQDESGGLYWVTLDMRTEPDAGKTFVFRDGKIAIEGEGKWR